jgi:hypothetical protein
MARQILGILAAPLQLALGWSEAECGFIVTSFQVTCAIPVLVVLPGASWHRRVSV